MTILGAHMSIAGGYYRSVEAAHTCGCSCVQLFTKNNNQWRAKPITPDEVARFQNTLRDRSITHPLAHSSYLINLAAPAEELWKKSIDAMVVELQRADQLGIPYVVVHPGSYTDSSEEIGLQRIVTAVDEVHRQAPSISTQMLLETTAGQGTCLGWRFEHLAYVLNGVRNPDILGVCFDTCHVFAAGYPLAARADYRRTFTQFDHIVGLQYLRAFHLNDSKRPLGARVDRHEHIGRGQIGVDAFRHLLRDRRFRQIPMYLETPKGEEEGEELDVINLRVLRKLASQQGTPT